MNRQSDPPTTDRSTFAELVDVSPEIVSIGAPVTAAEVQVDDLIRVTESRERQLRLQQLLDAWKVQQREERELRQSYAKKLMTLVSIELAFIGVAFVLVAVGVFVVQEWVASVFLVTGLLQSCGLLLVVVKYLFPDRAGDVMRLIELESNRGETGGG